MDRTKLKKHLPTVTAYLEKRRKIHQNRLPKHLRPPAIWPIWVHLFVNTGLIISLWNLAVSRDDFLTEAGPAVALVVCFLLLIYLMITASRMRRFYAKIRGARLAKINFGLMIIAFLFWAATIVVFIS